MPRKAVERLHLQCSLKELFSTRLALLLSLDTAALEANAPRLGAGSSRGGGGAGAQLGPL